MLAVALAFPTTKAGASSFATGALQYLSLLDSELRTAQPASLVIGLWAAAMKVVVRLGGAGYVCRQGQELILMSKGDERLSPK